MLPSDTSLHLLVVEDKQRVGPYERGVEEGADVAHARLERGAGLRAARLHLRVGRERAHHAEPDNRYLT